MASVEEFCNTITEQLRSFYETNAQLCIDLQAENNTLRANLASFNHEAHASQVLVKETNIPCSKASSEFDGISEEWDSECRPSRKSSPLFHVKSQESMCSSLDGVWLKWHKLISTMMNMSVLGVQRSNFERALLLRPAWEASNIDSQTKNLSVAFFLATSTKSPSIKLPMSSSFEREGLEPFSLRVSRYSRFILHPDCKRITVWSIIGALMILYDVLAFPMAGFDLKESDFALVVMWLTTIFWSLDLVLSFFRGVHTSGVIEMRPARICCLYAKSWLVVDLILIMVDWFVLYLNSVGDNSIAGASKVLRSGKALRAARVVRAVRLIRTIKAFQYLRDVFESIKSEYCQLIIKLFGSVACLLVLNHYVACSWFAQAHFNDSGARTWISVFLGNDPRPPFGEEYATSMHFSLTQLTGSQNIVPQNAQERVVASIIIVFDIVIFSTLVGTITDIMAQFRILTFERSKETNLIRKFFARAAVPPILETRIWHFFRRHYRSKNVFVNECEIEFFKYLPSSLKMDLHQHLYIPVLSGHPLFKCILTHDRYSLLAVCVTALSTANLVPGAEVFAEGDIAKFMFFITRGFAEYIAAQFGIQSNVAEDMWVAEPALWSKWMHCGRLTSNTNCEILKVDADMFEKTLHERAETADWFRGLRKYAALFAQRVSDSLDTDRPITDVDQNVVVMMQGLDSIVDKSFSYMVDLVAQDEEHLEDIGERSTTFFTPFRVPLKKAMSTLSFIQHSFSSSMPGRFFMDQVPEQAVNVAGEDACLEQASNAVEIESHEACFDFEEGESPRFESATTQGSNEYNARSSLQTDVANTTCVQTDVTNTTMLLLI